MTLRRYVQPALVMGTLLVGPNALSSSHREAPFITENPKVDGTDFYAFRSYEAGRDGYVTLIANYVPLQDVYGGPNYFALDPDALYEIHIDNNGDAKEDLTFQFDFDLSLGGENGRGIELDVGPAGQTQKVSIPLGIAGAVTGPTSAAQNVHETYTLSLVSGDRRTGTKAAVAKAGGAVTTFDKPLDNIGPKTFPDYKAYAGQFIYDVDIPGCTPPVGTHARVFVGQRQEGFAVNLGEIFDLVNADLTGVNSFNPIGLADQGKNILAAKSITTLAVEVPIACVKGTGTGIIGTWTTASLRQARVINPAGGFKNPTREGGPWAQVSRLGAPLVNEVVIGIADKDKFNASEPKDDGANFAAYVTNPTLPELLEILFPGVLVAPNKFPRTDLLAAFAQGVTDVNANGSLGEMLRLNTNIPATPKGSQVNLGAAGCFDPGGVLDVGNANPPANPNCDPAGFPDGRRPGDDVVDIALRVAMGYLLPAADAPSGAAPLTDGATVSDADFDATFPYLRAPAPYND